MHVRLQFGTEIEGLIMSSPPPPPPLLWYYEREKLILCGKGGWYWSPNARATDVGIIDLVKDEFLDALLSLLLPAPEIPHLL